MRRLLIFISLCLLSPLVFADTSNIPSIFDISSNDQSILYLNYLFGSVGSILSGVGGSPLLKSILVDFNDAVLVLGGIIILYSMIISTVNTAHEGEMLGKQWNSVWVPLRAAGGFALLLPVKANGYALIQVFVMYVIVQGVGAADYLWTNGVGMIETGQAQTIALPTTGVYQAAQDIFLSEVCMINGARVSGSASQITPSYDNNSSTQIENFGIQGVSPNNICGSVTSQPLSNASDPTDSSNNIDNAINAATQTMVDQLQGLAEDYIQDYNAVQAYQDTSGGTVSSSTAGVDDTEASQIQASIQSAANQYSASVQQAQEADSADQNAQKADQLNVAKELGWLYAGAYFITLSQASNDAVSAIVEGPDTSGYSSTTFANTLSPYQFIIFNSVMTTAKTLSTPSDQQLTTPTDITDFLDKVGLGWVQEGFYWLLGEIGGWVSGSGQSSPILAIELFGWVASKVIVTAWFILAIAVAAIAGIAYTVAGEPLVSMATGGIGYAITTFLTFVTVPIMAAVGILLAESFMMAYYIPLIPYFIYTIAAIGWFMITIEAMAAAPLLAIGIIHPEGGHPIFGRAAAGISILLNVFLRPPLMVVGFFAGTLLSYVVMSFICLSFAPIGTQVAAGSFLGFIMIMGLFVMFILVGLNRCFSLIYVLPDRILRWVGGQPEGSFVEGEMQGVKGGAESGKGSLGGAGGAISQGLQAGAMQKTANDAAKSKADPSSSATSGAGSSSGGSSGGGGSNASSGESTPSGGVGKEGEAEAESDDDPAPDGGDGAPLPPIPPPPKSGGAGGQGGPSGVKQAKKDKKDKKGDSSKGSGGKTT